MNKIRLIILLGITLSGCTKQDLFDNLAWSGDGTTHEMQLSFDAPKGAPAISGVKHDFASGELRVEVVPNPHTNGFDFEYDLSRSGHLRIILTDVYNPANLSILENQPDAQAGSYQKTVNTSLLSSGLYALIVQFDGNTQSFTIVKQ